MPRPRTAPLFPYTTLFRSEGDLHLLRPAVDDAAQVAGHGQEGPEHEKADRDGADGERVDQPAPPEAGQRLLEEVRDRKSTRLNSSHSQISYAVFCLKKKTS